MNHCNMFRKRIVSLLLVSGLLTVVGFLFDFTSSLALDSAPTFNLQEVNAAPIMDTFMQSVATPEALCPGGPVIDGVTLDKCVDETFMVGGTTKTIRVWYTTNVSTVQRTVDDVVYDLTHYVDNDTQAQNVAHWGREAWERYWEIFSRHPYNDGCDNRINIQLEDGVGWSGVAYWASPGTCKIGIDTGRVRAGTAQSVVYHEVQHYLQYSYNSGCYSYIYDNYYGGSAAGVAEFVEGYADVARDAVNAAIDLTLYDGYISMYNPELSFYDMGYKDVFSKYFVEQLGIQFSITDPHWHMDAIRKHYEECDAHDTIYVMDTLVPALKSGMTEEKLFLDFFAANWTNDWANPVSQPELVYIDDDTGPSYGSITLYKDENISSGTKNWSGESTPDDWAARYYQVTPQSGCNYVTANVDGAAGAHLGINLMAADTDAPTSVTRTAWIGENMSRTFPGFGTYNRIVAVVNAFDNLASYDVSFTCVTPTLDILEPSQANFSQVGDSTSPIAFLMRFNVTSSGSPVLGLTESALIAEAEGDTVTLVPGSLSQVGEQYWAILLPPSKPSDTTFVDLKICLDASICDTETDAMLYVDPGTTDFALVFDGSGSMSLEDVTGDGRRFVNAQKAGTVLADLLQVGDRILVTDFSAFDDPIGCGMPSGDGDCKLDIITRLTRTNVVTPASNAIAATKAAINNISPREWTPIGAALQDAMKKLVAEPASKNPKHIILLSDGDENVNPLYTAVKDDLIDSGVVVDTIRFSNDAPGALLAKIATDTGGSYTYVPTSPGTLAESQQSRQQLVDQLTQMGVPADQINRLTAISLPGPLGLDNVYDYYETRGQNAVRLFHNNYLTVPDNTAQTAEVFVDDSINSIRFVVAGKQEDLDLTGECGGYIRRVEIKPPSEIRGFPISPRNPLTTPANWDIRNSLYDDVAIIPNPEPGLWQISTTYFFYTCTAGSTEQPFRLDSPQALESDFMMNVSVESNIQLIGRFLPPIINNQGTAGDYVPIVASLFDPKGAIPGAEFYGEQGVIPVLIDKPGGLELIILWDDGKHNDGSANDGVYGGEYRTTNFGGNYNVRMVAYLKDPDTGKYLTREWSGGFFLTGPSIDDLDKDGMPDAWERRCKLNTQQNDAGLDNDHDGLSNIAEFNLGTLPCQADTDQGGERDGSEVNSSRNPLYPRDDLVPPLGHLSVVALNSRIRIQWTNPISYTNMVGWFSTVPGDLGRLMNLGNSGIYTDTEVINGTPYFVVLAGRNGTAEGEYSDPFLVTPKADPDAPSGAVLINNGANQTSFKNVILNVSSADTPLNGLAESANAHMGGPLALKYNEVSGNIHMRISNKPNLANAVWEPLTPEKPWTLPAGPAGAYTVFVQFRDGAGNESFVVSDTIIYTLPSMFIPLTRR